jgi:shikimate kinase / 3-dehydroquinate synthase
MTPASFIFLYGPPASGKTSTGLRLAENLHLPFYDLDELIETQAGSSIPQIFASEGEAGFREREAAALKGLLNWQRGVVALGGGALLRPENRRLVESAGTVVCLSASFDTILERLEGGDGGRPLLEGEAQDQLHKLLQKRDRHYTSFGLQVESDQRSVDQTAWQAQVCLGMFRVEGMGAGYDVLVRQGGMAGLGLALRERKLAGPLALVSDENVAPLYAELALSSLRGAGYNVEPVVIPAGEQHKTLATVNRLWESFLQSGLERGSTVIALGGGVVGDLAGFAAAVYLRGVRWVALPTSLLSMVDASLGGKTGCDLPQGKNLVGAFHPPSLVLADPQVLETLPETELRNGLAEVLKHGILGDPVLFERCSRGWQAVRAELDPIVRQAMSVKLRIIQEDPYERGERASLNLGHTLGHALEQASDFRIKHGEGVAIGTLAAARLSEQMGLAQAGLSATIEQALDRLGLPIRVPLGLERERILSAMTLDKKRQMGKIRLVLPVRIGASRWGVEVDNPAQLLDLV